MEKRVPILLLLLLLSLEITVQAWPFSAEKWVVDGKVLELDDFNFDSAIAAFNYTLVDFYAPWCIHCKHLSPELDKAAPALAALKEPIVIAKVNADKFTRLATKYNVRGFPTLKLFVRGVPLDYNGPRKAYLLVHYLKKLVAPDVSILDSDTAISGFVEAAGADFPIYIGFGLNGSVLSDLATKYTKKAWFSVAKDFSENMMVLYDFDKVPALVVRHPRYIEQSVFYGPFEVEFLEDFVKQNMFPLAMPITYDTLKLLDNDERKIVLTIVEDEDEEKSKKLIRILKSAASANRDLVFAYVSIKQWEEFANTFSANKKTKLPKMVVWNRNEDYLTDLMTKKTIGKRYESGGLYVLDPLPPTSIACLSVASAFEAHCRLGHPSLPLLKSLCPQYSKVSSLDCESCQFAKYHRVSLSSRVNKRASVLFELVHSDVWGLSLILSKPGFRYFVTFMDDFSLVTWLYLMKNRYKFSIFCA
ncbi:protein disulfide isomerase-like 5-2 isoform X1 [Humulus lupulus]|uniref:protein disulfide isomerase-like 5-2 isoform X1 n=1 Tax=Humulus lupulus TaxID=3486 RepID=UPI002B402553|nr:protein disulfide isomerase-like 5-2 isoform X1 [Humulus lupulus]